MNKILTFADGQTFTATDSSTIYSLKTVEQTFDDLDEVWAKFTVENMASCIFDGETYQDIIPVSISATKEGDSNILVTVTCRDISQAEIIARQAAQIEELQEAVAELG